MGTDLPDDFDSRILPLEISNRLIPTLRRLWFPTDEAELGVLGGSERTRRFQFSDERVIECLRNHPDARMVVDFWYYFFDRPGSPLRSYLHGEGSGQVLFFSPQAMAQWDRPRITDADVAR